MPGTALPPLVPQRVQHRADVVSAYNMLLRLETTILAEDEDVDLMYCRIVGHFFHHVPSDRGLTNLVREVSSTGGDRQNLLDIGKQYYDSLRLCEFILSVFYLRIDKISVRSAKEWSPFQSRHPSRPSFNTLADMIKSMLEEAPTSHETAKRKARSKLSRLGNLPLTCFKGSSS